jgi:hypothetical protein
MSGSRVLVSVLTLALFGVGGLLAQDAKKDSASKAKGTLPQNWSKLGLSDEQKQKIYTVQAEHKDKIEALEKQISDLKKKQMDEMTKVLTAAQKARLKEIVSEKVGADDKTEEKPKKPSDK